MNIDGVLRLDLSRFVDNGLLFVDGDVVRYAYQRMGAFAGAVLLDIGDAEHFALADTRLVVDALVNADTVMVIGNRPGGIASAVELLAQVQLAGPRGGVA